MKILIMISVFMLLGTMAQASIFDDYKPKNNSDFLPSATAFPYTIKQKSSSVDVLWVIPRGYYLYQDKTIVEYNNKQIPFNFVGDPIVKYDPNFDKDMVIYYEFMEIKVPKKDLNSTINITYQGCAEGGLCYTPQTRSIVIEK